MENSNHLTLEKETTVFEQIQHTKANNFDKRISAIWDKVALLEGIKYIENEREKFVVAYRFMEIELEKVCQEKESLQKSLVNMIKAHSR